MKKVILMSLALLVAAVSFAQRGEGKHKITKEEKVERFESMKVAHLTKALELSPDQAQRFWPVYNKYDELKKSVRSSVKKDKKVEDMTEAEAEAFIKNGQAIKQQMLDLDNAMLKDLEGVLAVQQRVKLVEVQKDFHKRVVKRYAKRKKFKKKKQSSPDQSEEMKELEELEE